MKKLMILGGSRYIIPVIKKAHDMGIYVITCDFLPENIAHKYSDQYCNVSIIDKEATLKKAQELQINGVISFACDPGVITAAYIAEKMNLPFQGSYESVRVLQDKGLFREFLTTNKFNCPKAKRYTDKIDPYRDIDYFNWPVIVKPVDSAGSKGISKVETKEELSVAIKKAIEQSHNGAFIIEEFLHFDGFHSSADIFTVNGKIEFVSYSDQLFDRKAANPYAPTYIIWPSTMKKYYQDELTRETQRLMNLLGMRTGIYNVESCVANGKVYLMEVSPRGGGCKIAELEHLAYGIDFIENEIRMALDMPLVDMKQKECMGNWCEMVVHSLCDKEGVLNSICIDDEIERKYLMIKDLSVKKGDLIEAFTGANMSLGDLIFKFESREQLDRIMSENNKWLQIKFERINAR